METTAPFVHTGGCACGAVRFEVLGRRLNVGDCHCRMCQRSVGAAFVTWASLQAERLRFVRGEPRWWRSSARAERGFCEICGSSLVFRALDCGPLVDVTVASFDDPSELRPKYAIWTASRQPWVHLDPEMPTFEAAGPDWTPAPRAAEASGEPGPLTWREGPPVDAVQLGQLFSAVGFSRNMDPGVLAAMIDGSRWVISAWRGDELVGFARAIADGVSNAYVSTVAVRPDLQRQGIGRQLMERLLAGRTSVKFVLRTSAAGEKLYRSLGFEEGTSILVRPRAGGTA